MILTSATLLPTVTLRWIFELFRSQNLPNFVNGVSKQNYWPKSKLWTILLLPKSTPSKKKTTSKQATCTTQNGQHPSLLKVLITCNAIVFLILPQHDVITWSMILLINQPKTPASSWDDIIFPVHYSVSIIWSGQPDLVHETVSVGLSPLPGFQWQMKVYMGFPTKHVIILVVTVTRRGDNPKYQYQTTWTSLAGFLTIWVPSYHHKQGSRQLLTGRNEPLEGISKKTSTSLFNKWIQMEDVE